MASIKTNCRKVVCVGRNYADHIKELSNARPKKPFFFLKPPSSILPPNSGPVLRPKGVDLHYEAELALIMGQEVRDLRETDEVGALGAIECTERLPPGSVSEAYAVSIDLTGRNLQNEAKNKGLPWSIAKGFDTFCPVSNSIPKLRIPDPHDVELFLSVNNEIRQNDSTNLMLFRIPRLLSDISQVMTLEKGDVVLTGTPKGVGSIDVGDVMRAGVKVGNKEIEEGAIEVRIAEKGGLYAYEET